MKSSIVKFCKLVFYGILTIIFLVSNLNFKILDPQNYNAFLYRLEYALDKEGFDIVQKWESNVSLEGRPTLAPLADYNLSFTAKQNEWTQAFTSYYANGLVAIPSKQSITAGQFMSKWNQTPIEKRVFISFTKDDLPHAEKIKTIMEAQGYKVFLYTESHRAPFTSPEMIVNCMKTAGEVLVLDTEKSRNKIGVIAEALAFAKYTYRPEKEIVEENDLLKQQIKETVNGVEFKGPTSDQMTENSINAYKQQTGVTYSKEDIAKKMQGIYKTDYRGHGDLLFHQQQL